MKRILFLSISLLYCLFLGAQTVNIYKKDGSVEKFYSKNVMNVSFSESESGPQVHINLNDKKKSYSKDEFDYFNFTPRSGHKGTISDRSSSILVSEMRHGFNMAGLIDGFDWDLKQSYINAPEGKKVVKLNEYNGPVTDEVVRTFIDDAEKIGCNIIRLNFAITPYMNENYEIDEEFFETLERWIDIVLDAGMYCMITSQNDFFQWSWIGDKWVYDWVEEEYAEYVNKRYEAMWKALAERFKDYNEYLLFEAMNEPSGDLDVFPKYSMIEGHKLAFKRVNELNQIFYTTVRNSGGNNKKRTLVFAPVGEMYFCFPFLDYPQDDPHIAVSAHIYPIGRTYTWDETDFESRYIFDYAIACIMDFKKTHPDIPVIIGEYGSTEVLNEQDRIGIDTYLLRAANIVDAPCLRWEYGWQSTENDIESFAIYDRRKSEWHWKDLANAIGDEGSGKNTPTDYYGYDITEPMSFKDQKQKEYLMNDSVYWWQLTLDVNKDGELAPYELWQLSYYFYDSENMEEIEHLDKMCALRMLGSFNSPLTKLNTQNCYLLEDINIHNTKLEEIDLSNNAKLTNVDLTGNPSLKKLILRKDNLISTLNVDENVQIVYKE